MKRHASQGFTLIELLVVISIIGLLSSIVLASLNVARAKGALAGVILFTNHNHQKLGANALLSMTFNEGASVTPVDSTNNFSGNNIVPRSSNTPFSDGGNSFDNTGSNVEVMTANSGAPISLLDTSGFTTSVWVNTLSGTSGLGSRSIVYTYLSDAAGNNYNHYIRSSGTTFTCVLGNVSVSYTGPSDSNWHNITCTYDYPTNTTLVYFDGKMVNSAVQAGPFPLVFSTLASTAAFSWNNYIYVGGQYNLSNSYFKGYIDSVQVYSSSLTAMEAWKIYAMGADKHRLAFGKK